MYITTPYYEGKALIKKDTYANGGLCVHIIDDTGMPVAKLSVWVDATPILPDDCFFAKTYSENEGLLEALEACGAVEVLEKHAAYPICRLK